MPFTTTTIVNSLQAGSCKYNATMTTETTKVSFTTNADGDDGGKLATPTEIIKINQGPFTNIGATVDVPVRAPAMLCPGPSCRLAAVPPWRGPRRVPLAPLAWLKLPPLLGGRSRS